MRDFFQRLVKFAQNHPVGLSALVAALAVPFAVYAWGPTRTTFTMEKPASYVTFNSITNNPKIGDERNFVGIREKGTTGGWADSVKVQPGKEYTVRMYVHNNAASNLHLVAQNVVAKMNVPTNTGKSITIDGQVSASNAKPNAVWDNATFTSNENFNLVYVAGSALYENNVFKNGVKLPDSLVTNTGAKLGYDKLDGKIPGCTQYSGFVTITVKPQFASKPNLDIEKKVRKMGEKTWQKSVNINPNDEVEYQIHAKNVGNTVANNLVIRDILPLGLDYVKGSSKIFNSAHKDGAPVSDQVVADSGINLGAYGPNGGVYLRFTAKAVSNDKLKLCGDNLQTNLAQVSDQKIVKGDTANVIIKKTCDTPKPKPALTVCNAMTVTKISRTKFEFNTAYKVENTQFKGVKYVVKDQSGKVVVEKVVNNGTKLTLDIEQTGKFKVESTVLSDNGQNTGPNCAKEFVVEEAPKPKPALTVCNAMTVTKISRTKFEFNVSYTVQNTKFVGVKYIIKDPSGKVVSEKMINGGSKFTFESNQSGEYKVTAIIISGNGNSTKNCEQKFEITKEEEPGISVTKTVNTKKSETVESNKDFTWEIVVRNTGNKDLENVVVTDNAPANTKFVKADKGSVNGDKFTYKIASLKVGQSEKIVITAQATASNMKATNIVCVDTTTIPGDKDACDSANVNVPPTPTPNVPNTPPSVPELPNELPKTGADIFTAVLGLGSLTVASFYYIASRKSL